MGWDFSTEPDFQKKLDWVDEFCKNEIEPLDLIFPYAVRSRDPDHVWLRPSWPLRIAPLPAGRPSQPSST